MPAGSPVYTPFLGVGGSLLCKVLVACKNVRGSYGPPDLLSSDFWKKMQSVLGKNPRTNSAIKWNAFVWLDENLYGKPILFGGQNLKYVASMTSPAITSSRWANPRDTGIVHEEFLRYASMSPVNE